MRSSIQAAMTRSQGQRSSSVSGTPACIFSTFAAGWNSSASAKRQPRRPASSAPTVDLPLPDAPATITITIIARSLGHLVADDDLAGVKTLDRDHPGALRVREGKHGLALGGVHGDAVVDMPLGVVDRHPEHGGGHALQPVVA